MKTKITIATIFGLIFGSFSASAQNPSICSGQTVVLTATNSANLSGPTYSMNPGGVTSPNPTFAVSPASTTTYTLYVTGTNSNSAVVTSTGQVIVNVAGSPTFSLTSTPSGYTLGCATNSVIAVSIINAQTTPVPGGSVSYTLVSPGNPTTLPTGTLSTISIYSINIPGQWYAVVKDNTNGCASWAPFQVTTNTTTPSAGTLPVNSTLTCTSPSVQVNAPLNPNWQYSWTPSGTTGTSIVVTANTTAPLNSVAVTLTLEITDVVSLCKLSLTAPVIQNIYPPNALIATGGAPACVAGTVMLTNQSSTGIPPGTFPTNSVVAGQLWQGPSPLLPATLSSTYIASVSGVYTMTALDMNNGCAKDATVNVDVKATAAFVHTLSSGQATFQSTSGGVGPNSAYFWSFGDGTFSTAQNPVHAYQSGGSHLVKLKVTNPGSVTCADSITQSVNVSGIPCVANSGFTLAPTSTAQVWNAIPAYPWNITAATWSWGDGSVSNTLYTSHQYSAAGMYNICLSVTVSCVASSSTCASYSVYRSSQPVSILEVNVVNPELSTGLSGTEITEEFLWSIAPNPNSGRFHIISPTAETVEIMDLTGRAVFFSTLRNDAARHGYEIDAGEIAEGMYIVTIQAGTIRSTKRLVVSR